MSAPQGNPGPTPTVTLVPGPGIVIRKPGLLCVVADTARALVPDLLELHTRLAGAGMPRRGRQVVRAIAQLVATADFDSSPDVGCAAPDAVGIAIYLSGSVFAEADGRRLTAGGDLPFDRAIPWPYEGLGLYVADAVPAEPGEETFDLVEGYVPAAGALMHTPLGMRGTEIHEVPAHPAARQVPSSMTESPPPAPTPPAPIATEAMAAAEPEDVAMSGAGMAQSGRNESGRNELGMAESGMAGQSPAGTAMAEQRAPADQPAPDPMMPDQMAADPLMPAPVAPAMPEPAPAAEPPSRPFTSTPLFGGPTLDPEPVDDPPPAETPAHPDPPRPGPRVAPGPRLDKRFSPPTPVPASPPPLPPPPAAEPEPVIPAGGFRSDSLQSAPPDHREPLPVQEKVKSATEVVNLVESRAHVHGIRCSRGHLNHPRSWLCGVCGIRMDQLTGILVEGERPPLGWLLLDNGTTYLLDEDLVLGREPGAVAGRRRGGPKPIRVPDDTGQLSRRHIEIRLIEWDVHLIDLTSANGTFVSDPALGNREVRLPPNQPHVLSPGSHVRIGGRHFIFESPHART
ncbi:MAG: FHA domain-containing protein [Gordonia sp. (in: high G+C Gram-positive bacteria)]